MKAFKVIKLRNLHSFNKKLIKGCKFYVTIACTSISNIYNILFTSINHTLNTSISNSTTKIKFSIILIT